MMKGLIAIVLFFILTFFCSYSHAQNYTVIDSLNNITGSNIRDTQKVRILLEIGDQYEYFNADSAIIFYEKAINLCETHLGKEKNADIQNFYNKYKAISLQYTGLVYANDGQYQNALTYYDNALSISKKLSNSKDPVVSDDGKKRMSYCYINMGLTYSDLGDFSKSINNYLSALKIAEGRKDSIVISKAYNNIGNIHKEQGNYERARDYFMLALKIKEKQGDKRGMAMCYNNLGIIWRYLAKKNNLNDTVPPEFKESLNYCFKSLELNTEINDQREIVNCNLNIGNIFRDKKDFIQANGYYEKSLVIALELKDPYALAMIYGNLCALQTEHADKQATSPVKQTYYRKAISYGTQAINYSLAINANVLTNRIALYLSKAYTGTENYKKALEYANLHINTKDSIFNEEKTKALADAEARFESEKKQLQIEKLEKDKELQSESLARKEAENRKQLIIIYFVVTGLFLIVVFSVLILRLFFQKKRANRLLARQNVEILQKNEEISAQRDEITSQRDNATRQRDIITIQKRDITDSIEYASKIQSALLPGEEEIMIALNNFFIFHRPRNIVSGDFYWVNKSQNRTIVVLADCTGHGVPGAFMSMLGIAFLNEIVNTQKVTSPEKILDRLRENIILAMKQHGENIKQQDGMDAVVVSINRTENTLEFAGANNPLYIIKRQNPAAVAVAAAAGSEKDELKTATAAATAANDRGLIEVKGDKMPVSVYRRMTGFTKSTLQIEKGDMLYLFSDGFADQMGGDSGKKFKYTPFKELLITISKSPVEEQKLLLEKAFDSWKGKHEQIDDVLVMGINI